MRCVIDRRWTVLAIAAVVASFGVLLFVQGLENADRLSSVIAAAAGVIGLVVSLLSLRRPADSRQSGSTVYQADHGTIHVHHRGRPESWFGPALLAATLLLLAAWVVPDDRPAETPAPAAGSELPDEMRDEMPLDVAVERHDDACATDWFLPKTPEQLQGTGPVPDRWGDWQPAADGAAAGHLDLLVTVQAKGDASVTLTGLEVSVERAAPRAGTRLSKPCGGPTAGQWVELDLDDENPTPRTVVDEQALGGLRVEPVQFPYEVTRQDAETFVIRATTDGCLCTWTARLRWASAGRTGTVAIDDEGRPFKVSATGNAVGCTMYDSPANCS
jgi:hypothetical protein